MQGKIRLLPIQKGDRLEKGQLIAQLHLQGLFEGAGTVETMAHHKALEAMHLLVKTEAMFAAFDDCFLTAALILLLALVPTLLLQLVEK